MLDIVMSICFDLVVDDLKVNDKPSSRLSGREVRVRIKER